jgi:AraC family transcriptional regulator
MDTRPTPDTRVAVALHGRHNVEVLKNGRWRGAEVRPGDIGMTAGNEVDSLRCWAQAPFESAHLYLPAQVVEAAAEHLRRAGQRAKPTALSRLTFADPAVTTVVDSLLVGMRTGAPDLYADQAAHWLATHLLVAHALADSHANLHRGERLTDQRLARVLELMRARYADPLSLEMLASEAYVSKFHFSRLFRAQTGLSPHAFLVAERMKAARRLLATTDLPVFEIATRAGYRSAHFGVAFKNAHGVTASDFRRQRRRHAG